MNSSVLSDEELTALVPRTAERLRRLADWLDAATFGLVCVASHPATVESDRQHLLAGLDVLDDTSSAVLRHLALAWARLPHEDLVEDDAEALVEEALIDAGVEPAEALTIAVKACTGDRGSVSPDAPHTEESTR